MAKYSIRGKYNDISNDVIIGDDTILSSFIFIGKNVVIGKNCNITNYVEINSDVTIGDNVNLQPFSILNSNTIIEDDVMFSIGVKTADEKYLTPDTKRIVRIPCHFKNNCRIGIDSTIISSTIGQNSIVGAKSLVLKDVPDNEVWVGNPAKFLMTRKEYDQKQKEFLIDQNL